MLPFELTKDTPYLVLSGELWSVFYEYINRNRPCYKGFLLYQHGALFINAVLAKFEWLHIYREPDIEHTSHFDDEWWTCLCVFGVSTRTIGAA